MLKIAQTGLKELSAQPWDFMPTATELYIRCDQLELASDCISKLRQKDIAPATTAFLEGLLADKRGKGYEAVKCWYRAIQLGNESAGTRLALAVTLSRLGDKQSAIRQLRTLVSERPNLFEGHLNLAKLLAEIGNWAEAAEQANMAIQLFPKNLESSLVYIRSRMQLLAETKADKDSRLWQEVEDNLASLDKASNGALPVKLLQFQLATRRYRFDKARQLLGDIKNNYPAQIDIDMAEVELLTAEEKTDEAIAKLYDIVPIFPDSVGPLGYLVALLAEKNDRQSCENIITDALTRTEPPAIRSQLALLLADLYNRWGEQDKRYQLLNSLTDELPDDIVIQRELLRCEKLTKDTIRAQQIIDKIKVTEGENGWQWRYEQARIWLTQDNFKDRYPQILSLLKENLLANPDDQSSRMLLAYSYELAGDLRLAISTYNEALNRSPRDVRIIVPAVAALYKANEYDRADEILRLAAGEKLSHPELKRLEFQSYLKRGELSPASDILEDLLADDPNNRSVCLSLALLKMRQNSFIEADELLGRLKVREPNSLPVTVAQIELNVRQDNVDEALVLCEELINNFNNALAYIIRARTYAMLGRLEDAKKDFEYAAVLEPNNVNVWIAKSDFYRSTDQLDEAVADIQKAMSVGADNLAVQKRAILLFLASGNPATIHQGKGILDESLTANPDDIDLRLYKARSLLTEGTAPAIRQATTILQKVTQDRPEISPAWQLLAEIALRQEQSASAIDIALRGLAHRPDNKPLLLLKARAEAEISPILAISTLKALQELDPNDADIVVRLADTYLSADQSEKAVSLLKTQLPRCSSTSDKRKINIALAVALYSNGEKEDALKEFDLLLQSAPDDSRPLLAQVPLLIDDQSWEQLTQKAIDWYESHPEDTYTPIIIARSLASTENTQARKIAEDVLRMILQNRPDDIEAVETLATLLQITGRSAEAAAFYQQVLTHQPDNTIAINNLAWIMCEQQGKYQQALELAQSGLEKAPDYTDLIDTRGVIYYRMGEFEKAVQDFTKCLELYPVGTPSAVASYLHLGRALARSGQRDEAVEILKKALELNGETGGLSTTDFAEAQRLLEELSQEGV
jgi:tetratricopeptide (TPR) repeat protein